jgi:hypothetical protein
VASIGIRWSMSVPFGTRTLDFTMEKAENVLYHNSSLVLMRLSNFVLLACKPAQV